MVAERNTLHETKRLNQEAQAMKTAYPVIFTQIEDGWYLASAPDFPLNTQGESLADAIFMARDAIGLMGISLQDDGTQLPNPSAPEDLLHEPNALISMVDIDFDTYRRANDQRAVRRNVSLPCWLNEAAERAGLNVSAVLQSALKQKLKVADR
jgi:predicted RNase H-like HicB family nuclease